MLPVLAVVGAACVAAVWLVPPVGFVAALVFLVVAPPWGRGIAERAVISGTVALGVVAVLVPRAGATPVTSTTARLILTGLVVLAVLLRLVPSLREVRIPRPTVADALVLVVGAASSLWLMAAYLGRTTTEVVSGLFFTGWDNQGHFTTFANTYAVGSTTWPTVDGSLAWNQWYPSLHTTTWSLAQMAVHGSGLDRVGLVLPFVVWSALSFGACLAALAWVAGDLARRLAPAHGWAPAIAVAGFGVFALFGSPAFLFNKGFTNFMMGVTVTVVVAYLSARSVRSARTLGWFLVPLGALVIIGLWTPLALGLVPSGVVVALALLSFRRLVGIAWLVGTAALGVVMALTQTQAILGVDPGKSAADFTSTLGSVGTGMAPFNVGAALAAPVVIALVVALLVRQRRWRLGLAVLGPTLGAGILAIVFAQAADSVAVGRLQSYYVLKCLDAMLLAAAPVTAALLAVGVVRAVAGLDRVTALLATAAAGAVAVGSMGYVGAIPAATAESVTLSPGLSAAADRARGVSDSLVGEAIVGAAVAAAPYADYTTLLWDGAGTLPNLWVSALTSVMSRKQNAFYGRLPAFPYDEKTAQYVTLAMNVDPTLRVAALWFRQPSGELLRTYVQERGDDRMVLVQVPLRSSPLCPECTGTG